MTRNVRRVALACASLVALSLAAPQATAAKPSSKPTFKNYREPGEEPGFGEPTIGVNWKTNTALYQSGLRTLAVRWDAKDRARWDDVSSPMSVESLDPIVFTDGKTGRTWVSQLLGACSLLSYTDDDGENWTPTQGCGPGAMVDHQTVAAGPYAAGLTKPPLAGPVAVYYCAQAVAEAACARSDTGGLTFGPASPMYTVAECGGLHGHLRVAPDGSVYVPHMGCGDQQAVVVSEDNGVTWDVRKVDGSEVNGESDPTVAAGADSTIYFGYQHGEGHDNTKAMVAVSRDHGRTWDRQVDVSSKLGIKNVQFPQIVAGDGDRAAMAFLGTKTGGSDQTNDFAGKWHLYIAMTYDRGKTWTTVDATPNELVQIGCIQLTGCNHRNLLDFNGIAVDKQGRVLVAWADGCPYECERGAEWDDDWHKAVITRQTGGKGLFKAYDGKL